MRSEEFIWSSMPKRLEMRWNEHRFLASLWFIREVGHRCFCDPWSPWPGGQAFVGRANCNSLRVCRVNPGAAQWLSPAFCRCVQAILLLAPRCLQLNFVPFVPAQFPVQGLLPVRVLSLGRGVPRGLAEKDLPRGLAIDFCWCQAVAICIVLKLQTCGWWSSHVNPPREVPPAT